MVAATGGDDEHAASQYDWACVPEARNRTLPADVAPCIDIPFYRGRLTVRDTASPPTTKLRPILDELTVSGRR